MDDNPQGVDVRTEEGRRAVDQEAQSKAEEFFDTGEGADSIAAVKLEPFATRTSFATFLEVAAREFK